MHREERRAAIKRADQVIAAEKEAKKLARAIKALGKVAYSFKSTIFDRRRPADTDPAADVPQPRMM